MSVCSQPLLCLSWQAGVKEGSMLAPFAHTSRGSTRRQSRRRSGLRSSRPTGALGVFLSALLLLFSLGCLAATICAFSGTDDYYLDTVIAGSLCDGSYRMGFAFVELFALPLHTARLSTLLVAGGALPVLSGRGARRHGPFSSALLLLFSRGCSAATVCTFEGTDGNYNTVTAGSLCDGSWVGDTYPTALKLYNKGLSGTVPTELALLPQLTYLALDSNDLSGTVPTEVGLMTNLTGLLLQYNSLSGSLPSDFGQLTKLGALYLFDNQFGGTIPQELANLSPDYACDLGGTNSWLCPLPDPPLDSNCLAGYYTPDLWCSYSPPPAPPTQPPPPTPPPPPPPSPPPTLSGFPLLFVILDQILAWIGSFFSVLFG
jgi:hypothetical protein